jgi:hypothetical protein
MSDVQEAPVPAEPGEPEPEQEKAARRDPARKGRCATHPGEVSVAVCDVCGRTLCIACAVPVRGSVVGQECLATVVEDPPPAPPARGSPARARAAIWIGFAITLGATILPWARYGDASGMFQAWTVHWSLLAAAAALAGIVVLAMRRRVPGGQFVLAFTLTVLAGVALLGVLLHGIHPPPLSERSPLGWGLAMLGSVAAVVGALVFLEWAVRSEA